MYRRSSQGEQYHAADLSQSQSERENGQEEAPLQESPVVEGQVLNEVLTSSSGSFSPAFCGPCT